MNELKPSLQNKIEIAELFRIAFRPFQTNPGLVIGGTAFLNFTPFVLSGIPILMILIGFIMSGAKVDPGDPVFMGQFFVPVLLAMPIFLCIYSLFKIGWISICLKFIAREEVNFSEFKHALSRFWPFLALQLLLFFIIGAGVLLFLIPGIFLAVRLAFSPFIMMDRNLGPLEAMKESWNLVSGFSWQVLLLCVAGTVLSAVANAIPLLGLFIAPLCTSYYDFLIATAYKARQGTLPEAEVTG